MGQPKMSATELKSLVYEGMTMPPDMTVEELEQAVFEESLLKNDYQGFKMQNPNVEISQSEFQTIQSYLKDAAEAVLEEKKEAQQKKKSNIGLWQKFVNKIADVFSVVVDTAKTFVTTTFKTIVGGVGNAVFKTLAWIFRSNAKMHAYFANRTADSNNTTIAIKPTEAKL